MRKGGKGGKKEGERREEGKNLLLMVTDQPKVTLAVSHPHVHRSGALLILNGHLQFEEICSDDFNQSQAYMPSSEPLFHSQPTNDCQGFFLLKQCFIKKKLCMCVCEDIYIKPEYT